MRAATTWSTSILVIRPCACPTDRIGMELLAVALGRDEHGRHGHDWVADDSVRHGGLSIPRCSIRGGLLPLKRPGLAQPPFSKR
jgi:hypothetical protein